MYLCGISCHVSLKVLAVIPVHSVPSIFKVRLERVKSDHLKYIVHYTVYSLYHYK
jgi:hypothetical protein